MVNKFPFNLSIPAALCDVKLTFHLCENIRLTGTKCISPPHTHNDWEIRYVTSGSANVSIENTPMQTKSGDLIIFHPGEMHFQNEADTSEDLVQYTFRFSLRKSESPAVHSFIEILNSIGKIHDDRFCLASLFNRLWKEITERKPGYFNYVQSLCLSILIEVLRLTGHDTSEIFTTDGDKYTNYWRTRLDKFLYSNFKTNVKLEDLADEIALSPRHASRMIEREYGITFIEKLTEIRLDNAKFKLKSTNASMEEIANLCGFQSYSYFTTCFKKNVGMTPGQYRNKFKGKD